MILITDSGSRKSRMKLLSETGCEVNEIHFYGARVINQEKGNIVKTVFQILYPKAEIEVESDLLAATLTIDLIFIQS